MESTYKPTLFMVVFLGLLTAITPLATDLYLPALPIMPGELNTSASLIQMTIGVMTFGIAFGQLLGGPLSDKYGRKWPLIIGNLLCVISSIICAYARKQFLATLLQEKSSCALCRYSCSSMVSPLL